MVTNGGSCDPLAAAFRQGEICISFWRANGYLRAEAEPQWRAELVTNPERLVVSQAYLRWGRNELHDPLWLWIWMGDVKYL